MAIDHHPADPLFPGVVFGYLCDKAGSLLTSPKWEHALFEAVNYVERRKSTAETPAAIPTDDLIAQSAESWLYQPWFEPTWSQGAETQELPPIDPFVFETSALESIGMDNGLNSAFVFGGGLIPLFAPGLGRMSESEQAEITEICRPLGFHLNFEQRLPVL